MVILHSVVNLPEGSIKNPLHGPNISQYFVNTLLHHGFRGPAYCWEGIDEPKMGLPSSTNDCSLSDQIYYFSCDMFFLLSQACKQKNGTKKRSSSENGEESKGPWVPGYPKTAIEHHLRKEVAYKWRSWLAH